MGQERIDARGHAAGSRRVQRPWAAALSGAGALMSCWDFDAPLSLGAPLRSEEAPSEDGGPRLDAPPLPTPPNVTLPPTAQLADGGGVPIAVAVPDPGPDAASRCGEPDQACCQPPRPVCAPGFGCDDTSSTCRRCRSFRHLDFFTGHTTARASALSADGSTVVGYGSGGFSDTRALRWRVSDGSVEALGTLPGGSSSYAEGVSADGSTVAARANSSDGSSNAALWTASAGWRRLDYGTALAVNADGSVAVGASESLLQAFRWTEREGLGGLGVLPGARYGRARALSADGEVVAGEALLSEGGLLAFRWTRAEGILTLGTLVGGTQSSAQALAADGRAVFGVSDSAQGWQAFRWTEAEGMLGLFPVDDSSAIATNASGSLVVSMYQDVPVIWESARPESRPLLDLLADFFPPGWELRRAVGISARGDVIAGNSADPDFNQYAWVAVLGPSCSAEAVPPRSAPPDAGPLTSVDASAGPLDASPERLDASAEASL